MKRLISTLALALLGALAIIVPAQAEYGFREFDVRFLNQDGTPATQAGSHPFEAVGNTELNSTSSVLDGELKDLLAGQIVGLVGAPNATPRCPTAKFLDRGEAGVPPTHCPDSSAIGVVAIALNFYGGFHPAPVYNLEPPPGVAAKIGFVIDTAVPVTFELGVNPDPPYNIRAASTGTPQILHVYGGVLRLWGVPGDPAHDPIRGNCVGFFADSVGIPQSLGNCPGGPETPFLTLPRACNGPLETTYKTDSWEEPGGYLPDGEPDLSDPRWKTGGVLTHDNSIPSVPQGMTGCDRLKTKLVTESVPTTHSAETGSGLDFNLDVNDEGITNPKYTATALSDLKKAEVTLPQGVTINPSVGEGLAVCTEAQLQGETVTSPPGAGCPNASKLGSLEVETPLVDEALGGDIFLAPQDDPTKAGHENPFDSLIALWFVIRNPTLGVIVKLPVKVEPDRNSGQLVVTLDDVPQFPISHFNAHLRTGARAALVTPSQCGTYETKSVFTPWANPTKPVTTTASFEINSGVGGGPCPPGGVPPFHPKFEAGSVNNNAGSFSPFNMRLIRRDGEQDMTKFSAILPPGELGSLAGVDKCPDSAIAIAKSKTGREELASPSCPANSLIGHTLAGAGVGDGLTYVGGQVYLGGPFHGDPLSVISVTPAVAGPFDAGTVVVQLALTLNPKTAEVEVDGANSDPIPHILKGIVLKLRDLRVYVDRQNFTLNPTNCEPSSASSILYGSFLNVLDPADDRPIDLSSRFQAASCASLGFKPDLKLNLKGGTKRGGHPGLRAIYTPKKGDANIKGLVVRLPRSAFLDQAHIKTICTRVQFSAKQCPARAQYGYIKAWTPLLDTPLEGPVYLRSSNHKLPDLVFDLHGLVDIEVAVRIDSAKGGIRATLENAPDAPLSKVDLRMQGAKKGLIINSRNLCGSTNRANVEFTGQNGKEFSANPAMKPECGGGRKRK